MNRTPNRLGGLLALMGRELVGAFQRLKLAVDRLYGGLLRALLVLARAVGFLVGTARHSWRAIRSFAPRVRKSLVSTAVAVRLSLHKVRQSSRRPFVAVRSSFLAVVAKGRQLLQRIRRAPKARGAGAQSLYPEASSERATKRARRLRSFLVKEMLDILQQPRLVVTLILGPFLILLIFGLGFTGKQGPANAIVVVPPDAEFPLDIHEQLERYRPFMPIQDVVDNTKIALEELDARRVEIVAVLPKDATGAVASGQKAIIDIYVDEYDPVRTQWLEYVSGFAAEDLNRQLHSMILTEGRRMLVGLQSMSTTLLDRLVELSSTVEAGDIESAKQQLDQTLLSLDEEVERLEPALHDLLLLRAVGEYLKAMGRRPGEITALLNELRDQAADLRELLEDPDLETSTVFGQIRTMRDTVLDVRHLAELVDGISDEVIVAPVATAVWNESPSEPLHLNFYAPAVLALLVQHMAVTFGSLTMVRERMLGAEELFRVAPISSWEILSGKFSGYTLFTVAVGILLSALLVLAIKIPMLGNVLHFLLTLILLATAGLGWGILVSLFSTRQSQAVQFTMLLLIASVFFGGFFLALSSMLKSIRFVSYSLPVTYGVKALREIMLAGRGPGLDTMLPLAGMTLGFYSISVLVYAWQNKRA
jgi:ABC-2 type transport system permease protein